MEMLLLDVARGASAAQITAVVPQFADARPDKKDASRISIDGWLDRAPAPRLAPS